MEITRQFIRICVIIFGILVLSSYVYGLSKADDKMALWGGKILGAASKKLDYLVVGDSKPTTKKVDKAKQDRKSVV